MVEGMQFPPLSTTTNMISFLRADSRAFIGAISHPFARHPPPLASVAEPVTEHLIMINASLSADIELYISIKPH